MQKVRKSFRQRPIRFQMMALVLLIVFAVSILFVFTIDHVFTYTENLLLEQSVSALNLYLSGLESEFDNLKDITYTTVTDRTIQGLLEDLQQPLPRAEEYMTQRDLGSYLSLKVDMHGSLRPISRSIILADTEIAIQGMDITPLTPDIKQQVLQQARQANGAMVIIPPGTGNPYLTVARLIRRYDRAHWLDEIGTLVVRIDVEQFLSTHAKYSNEFTRRLLVTSGDGVLFNHTDIQDPLAVLPMPQGEHGHSLFRHGGSQYLAVYRSQPLLGWTYYNVTETNAIFSDIYRLRNVVYLLLTATFLVVVLVSTALVYRLTKPIAGIIQKMRVVRSGSFDLPDDKYNYAASSQEIVELHDVFIHMVNEIRALINENYRKQLLLQQSQIRALQTQINPHFLYNIMDTIRWTAQNEQAPATAGMVKSLARLLRSSLDTSGNGIVTLRQEMELLEHYVSIQRSRYGDRLDYSVLWDRELGPARVPRMCLQPLVENAIKHALEVAGQVEIRVVARREDELLVLSVADNGPGFEIDIAELLAKDESDLEGSHIGLRNIDRRIKITCGETCGLQVENGERTVVTLRFPYREDEDDQGPAGG